MLSKEHRITQGSDYRTVVRCGTRVASHNMITHIMPRPSGDQTPRFGFIITKRVGNAVIRNRVRRRLKAAAYSVLPHVPPADFVIRAFPCSATASGDTLHQELLYVLDKTHRSS